MSVSAAATPTSPIKPVYPAMPPAIARPIFSIFGGLRCFPGLALCLPGLARCFPGLARCLPTYLGFFLKNDVEQCRVKSISIRDARAPPIKTFEEPVNTSKSGKKPPHHAPNPTSPHLAAGNPLIRTFSAPDKMAGPILGRKMGGAGGVRFGGCM